jgi:protein archease
MTYRFLDHTADALVECEGKTFEELLETAAHALYAVAFRQTQARIDLEEVIEVEGETREELLVRWLQELIYLMEVRYFVASVFQFERADDTGVRARVAGYTYHPDERDAEVKAATYHEMAIEETEKGLTTRIVFDL